MATAPTPPYVHQSYPAWRYHRVHAPRKVNDPNEEKALGPGWEKTPAAFANPEEPAPPADAEPIAMGVVPVEPPPPVVDTAAEEREAEARTTQFGMSVAAIDAALGTVDNPEALGRIRVRELLNPTHDGGRKGVLQAVARRLKALGVTTDEAADETEEPIGP